MMLTGYIVKQSILVNSKKNNIGQTSHFSSEVLPIAHVAPKDPGARDPDVRGAAIDRVNRFAVPESIGTLYPNLPCGHSVFNKDLVPKDVIDRGTATSAYLNHMKRESVSRA